MQDPVFESFVAGHVRILLEQDDIRARNDCPLALVRLDEIGEAFEQGCLPRAIAPDQRQPIALTDIEIEAAEKPTFALDESKAFVREDRCRHDRGPSQGCRGAGGVARAPLTVTLNGAVQRYS